MQRDPEVVDVMDLTALANELEELAEKGTQHIYGLSLEHGLTVVDCGATETVGSPEAVANLAARLRADNPNATIRINPEAGNGVRFKDFRQAVQDFHGASRSP